MRSTLLALLAATFLTALPASAQRLPTTVVPSHYDLAFVVDLARERFEGTETIQVDVKESTAKVVLNALEIDFHEVTIGSGAAAQTATVTLDEPGQTATLTVAKPLPRGSSEIHAKFSGILNTKLRGFYISKTKLRKYAVTQFEATDARRAFPCFDEPAFKATFGVTLTVDRGDTAISNGKVLSDVPGPAVTQHTMTFATTAKMSSYLVAMAVGDFKCLDGAADNIPIRICATPDKRDLGRLALESAEQILHFYNAYYDIKYPFGKLDVVAVPDFAAGAMENTGAIFYRETDLLAETKSASVDTRKKIAAILAHEMAHQWFGDLVTMQWWDNIWLNEGFASWMENKPVEAMHPEWNIDQTVISELDGILNIDAQPTTRTIRAKADTPDEINQMFDGITYGKAGAVRLTVENYVGAETFRQGVHNYLAAHLYGNATAEDFWGAQTANSHKPVDKIMESFVTQPGVAMVTFGEPSGGNVTVSQKRFFLSSTVKPDPAQKWTLPVCFKSNGKSQSCDLITPSSTSLGVPAGDFLFPHAGGSGYSRASYPAGVYKE